MEDVFGTVRRLGPTAVGSLVLALAVAPSTTRAVEPPPAESPTVPEPAEELDVGEAVIAALHREGEQRYADDEYALARTAWLDAYGRVSAGPEADPYRVTLLSLITNATLADYAVTGTLEPLRQTEQLLAGALETVSDPALRELLQQQMDRIQPMLRTEPEPEPGPAPVVLEPDHSPPEDESPPARHPAATPLIAIGAVTMAGGLAMFGTGFAFDPRAQQQVPADDDSEEGQQFIEREQRKGFAWIGAGAGTAAIGVALVVSGAVLRARSRRPARQTTLLVPTRGGVTLTLSRRF